jgi:hypothetical protein
MEAETIKILGSLSAITLAAIVLVYVARIAFTRSKSDTDTIKVFADLLSGAFTDIKNDVKSHGAESETRHTEILGAFREHMELTRTLINSFSERDKKIISSINDLSANVGAHIQKVNEVGGDIMDKVTPLDEVLVAIHAELKLLRQSVDAHLADSVKFRDDVEEKTQVIETRLHEVEKRVTQETPTIPKVLEPVPKTKPTDETQEKTE